MKEKRENYVKPLSYVIETEQSLMSGGSIGFSKETENYGGRLGVRRPDFVIASPKNPHQRV